MNCPDTLCLWVGCCVATLALVRAVIDSIFSTYRCYRRALRWMSKSWHLHALTAMTFEQRLKTKRR